MVAMDKGLKGPFYDRTVKNSLLEGGQWSDGMCDFATSDNQGLIHCLVSFVCPCIVLYVTLERIGQVESPFGSWDKRKFVAVYLIVCASLVLLLPLTCVATQTPYEGRGFVYAMFEIAGVVLVFISLKGIKDKVKVQELDYVTFAKSLRFSRVFFCLDCLLIAQASRHVNRMQGFWPMPGKVASVSRASEAGAQFPAIQECMQASEDILESGKKQMQNSLEHMQAHLDYNMIAPKAEVW